MAGSWEMKRGAGRRVEPGTVTLRAAPRNARPSRFSWRRRSRPSNARARSRRRWARRRTSGDVGCDVLGPRLLAGPDRHRRADRRVALDLGDGFEPRGIAENIRRHPADEPGRELVG